MKKINVEEKTSAFNKVRMENLSKTFFYEEIVELLKSVGISYGIFECINKHGFLDKETFGKKTLYSFQKNPIHKSQMEKFYLEKRNYAKKLYDNKAVSEDDAIKALKESGYVIKKVVGFDLERFQKENPEMYKKYLIYKAI